MNTHVESRWHFGVPILEATLPDFFSQQAALIAAFQALRLNSGEIKRSNQGGWHSIDNLHQSDHPSIQWLTREILRIGTQSIRHVEGENFNGKIGLTDMWVNINNKGNWNMPHSHLPNEWSGVAYISVPDILASTREPQNKQRDGDIIFINPYPIGRQYMRSPSVSYQPRNGLIFLFPGYLLHMVAPHNEDEDRISVAFNFKLIPTDT